MLWRACIPPIVKFPFPTSPQPFEPAPEMLEHVGFGIGTHHCLGAQLARIELQEAFRGLPGQLPGLRVAVPVDELRYKEKMTITSLAELPVTWDG